MKTTSFENVKEAHNRIRPFVRRTPMECSHVLSAKKGAEVYFKLENHQISGSFKPRGSFNRLLSLSPAEKEKGVVASTAGNHGLGVALAAHRLNIPAKIFLPNWVDPAKLEMLRRHPAELSFFESVELARNAAKKIAKEEGLTYVSPYNDPWMIAGGGTVAVEMIEDLDDLDAIFVGLGGGGLVAGVCTVRNALNPKLKVYAIQSENSHMMSHWLSHNKQEEIPIKPSLAEGLAVNLELDAITYPLLKNQIENTILVSESEIKNAMVWALREHQMVVEGAGAATIAALMKHPFEKNLKRVAGIITGQNISLPKLLGVISEV